MRARLSFLAAIGLCLAGLAASAQTAGSSGSIAVDHPYARATAAGQPAGGAYLRLQNRGAQADRLVGARGEVSRSIEIHEMKLEGDVMRMRQVEGIDVPANGTVELKPGGLHLMLMGLKGPLKEGEHFPLTLTFQKAGEVKVDFMVHNVTAAGAPASHAGHGEHGKH